MLRRVQRPEPLGGIPIGQAAFPSPFQSGLEYASPARGMWNIVHTGMLIPGAHEIFICAAGCLRGVVLTAAELGASHRFSTVEVREKDLLEGTLEELAIGGVCDILERLPKKPPVVQVYTSCVHHFSGCDLDLIYRTLRERYPEVDFVDCYMNPILRKSGRTPDQTMRSRLYQALKPRPIRADAVALVGSDLPLDGDSDLALLLEENGLTVHELHRCETYGDYQAMAESAFYISRYPAARAGGGDLEKRLGGRHLHVPFSYDYDEIEKGLTTLADALGIPAPDFAGKREECAEALAKTRALLGDTAIAIDYTFCPRPLGLAKLLLQGGMKVERVYLDAVIPEEKPAFDWLKENHPELLLYPTVHAAMRFHRETGEYLAVGQKAAHFCNTAHFVNVVEGGGMLGYQAIRKTLELIRQAYLEEKPLRELIQVKGMGCGGCI